jgi:hypothetical protein
MQIYCARLCVHIRKKYCVCKFMMHDKLAYAISLLCKVVVVCTYTLYANFIMHNKFAYTICLLCQVMCKTRVRVHATATATATARAFMTLRAG